VAERTGLTGHTLRYYERDGLMLGVDRAGPGHRRYSERDLGWIELITKLRATGMPIREVRRYAELVRAGDGNEDERLALLAHRERVRAQLETMTAYLDAIDMKITTTPARSTRASRRTATSVRRVRQLPLFLGELEIDRS
jgi:DNA-binding transcriptional MerR regulator